jgi:transposase-like protein
MRQRHPASTAALAKLIEELAAAVAVHRQGNPRRWLSPALRAQVVAAIEAGVTVRAVREACKVSASQITRWRAAAAHSGRDAAPTSTVVPVSPRVLSVVDGGTREDSRLDSEIELRIGGWHVSLRRVVE